MSARRASRRGDAGGLRDRVDHQPGERALPQLAGEQPPDEVRLVVGRPAEQRRRSICLRRPPIRCPVARLDVGDRAIEVGDT